MTDISYRPGPWLAILRGRMVVMLPGDSNADLVADVWKALGNDAGMDRLLEQVSGGFAHGWTGMRPFGVVSYRDALHAVLRGRIRLESTSDDGRNETVSGEQVATWSERILPGGNPFSVVSFGAAGGATDHEGPWFPLVEGVVSCAALRVVPDGSAPAETTAKEPAAMPVSAEPTAAESAADLNATMSPEIFGTAAQAAPLAVEAAAPPAKEPEQSVEAPEAAAEDSATGYDHLWDRTVLRRVEDAAVREEDEAEAEAAPTVAPGPAAAAPAPAPAPATAAPAAPAPAPAAPAPATAGPGAVELIDSVPWLRPAGSSGSTGNGAREDTDPAISATPTTVPDDLPATLPEGAGAPDDAGDHDGRTIMRSSLPDAASGGSAGASTGTATGAARVEEGTGPLVLARLCPDGHANPPTRPTCSICAKALATEPHEVRRPSLGRVHISTGEVIELDRPAVIGRQPSASRVQGDDMPRMVQVRSEAQDISRSHVEIRLDGWHVMLCDLKATNGTVLTRGDRPPRRLDQGETTIILDGDVAELGEDVTLRFEGIR